MERVDPAGDRLCEENAGQGCGAQDEHIDSPASKELRAANTELIRLRYRKTGKAKYISHLDLMATLGRAFLRAGIALKYSEGFNPHPYISIALPLPVGCESVCELADVRVTAVSDLKNIPERLTSVLPAGLEAADAYIPDKKFKEIAWMSVIFKLFYDKGVTPEIINRINDVFSAGSIIIPKKTKRGTSDIDIAPYIKNIEISGDKTVTMTAAVYAQNPSISPSMLMAALELGADAPVPDFYLFTRTEIYDINMYVFR